jgi:hypothetical protein
MPTDNARDTDIQGAGFADSLIPLLALTSSPEDRVPMEMGREIDRLENILDDSKNAYLKPNVKIIAIGKRVSALSDLYKLIHDRRDRLKQEGGATLVATLMLGLQEVMGELNLAHEIKTALIQNLLRKVEEEEKRKSDRRKV